MSDLRRQQSAQNWPVSAILGGVILGLFLMRFFLVAESAGQGETAWIVGLWMLVWFVSSILIGGLSCVKPGWLELSVGLLAGGHVLSALVILSTAGEKRSALNLAWEWCGIALAWALLRQGCRSAAFRREMVAGLLAAGTAVAGIGLYQHYYEFPRVAAYYGPMFDQLREGGNPANAAAIRKKMAKEQIPIEGPAFTLFEKRLRDSREPLGMFALANTLGGFLAVCLIIAVSSAAGCCQTNQKNRWRRLIVWIPPLLAIGWCLLLTKSRTAWVGTAVGLAIWSMGMGFVKINRIRLIQAGITAFVAILIGWGLTRGGGLDRQVLTEAPKSLEYRLQYWSATWPMIMHHPWLGVGPGQFRSNYLLYKLPEASEEISDPHNLFLDVAANGGIIALTGLLGVCILLAARLKRVDAAVENADNGPVSLGLTWGIIGVAIFGWCLLLITGEDDRLLVLLPISVALYLGFRRVVFKDGCVPKSILMGAISAGIALTVHLCGAGGIEMPAMSLLLLCLVVLGESSSCEPEQFQKANDRRRGVLQAVFSLALVIGLIFTTIWPVKIVQQNIAAGDRFALEGRLQAADKKYQEAAKADPLTDEPWRRRAELAFRVSEEKRFQSSEDFQNVVENLVQASARDPLNSQNERRLGECWMARWRVTRQIHDAENAVTSYERAWQRNPTNGILMAELAEAYLAAGNVESAQKLAFKAMEQDRINHERGHVDRYLPERVFEKMKELTRHHDGA